MKKIKSFLKKYRFWILMLAGVGVLSDIFISSSTADLVIVFLTGLWILLVRLYKFEGRVSVAGGLVFLAMCPFLLILKKESIAEKAAIWAYMFLVVGVVQEFIEYIKGKKE